MTATLHNYPIQNVFDMTSILPHQKKAIRSSLLGRFHFLTKRFHTLGLDDQPLDVCKQYKSTNMVIFVKYKKQKASAAMLNPY